MEENFNIIPESLPSESHVASLGGEGTVENVAIPLNELSSLLGKEFKDAETAKKAIKDTFSFVGKREEDFNKKLEEIKNSVPQGNYITKEQYETDMFYKDNPNLVGVREIVDNYAKAKGTTVREVVNDPALKSVLEKVQGYEETQKVKTVLESNPRIQASQDKLTQANEAVKSGNSGLAEELAAKAVMDVLSR